MYSLKHRLSRHLLINILLIMLALLGGLSLMMARLVEQHVVTRLQHDAESLISVLQQQDGQWRVDSALVSTIYNRVRSGHYYLIVTEGQVIRSRSLFDFEFEVPVTTRAEGIHRIAGPGDEDWLLWSQAVIKKGVELQIWVAEDIAPLYWGLWRLFGFALVAIVVLTLVSLWVQQRILDRAFKVFDDLREQLSAIRESASDLPAMQVPNEVEPLIAEIGLLVKQLQARTLRTRSAIANLSHELKRPLQVLSLHHADLDRRDPLARAIAEIRAIIERELRRARLAGSDRVGGRFDLAEELPFLVMMMQRLYPHIDIDGSEVGSSPALGLDRDDMLELTGNLLDNACKFGRERVKLSSEFSNGQFLLGIEDDGPGVDAEHLSRLTTRGVRLDETVDGHGMGLALCADIVAGFNGEMRFGRAGLGGLRVEISLPADCPGSAVISA